MSNDQKTTENKEAKIYKIGTRGSLLALTQCNQAKDELERLSGGRAKFELVVLKTQGDVITDKPLWQLEGKDFFTKELDAALLTGQVDMVVHSYKDLGSIRPEGIKLAAITERKYPHDILFLRKDVVEKLKKKELKDVTIGTSSPRRIVNIESQLAPFLPYGEGLTVKTKMLRGNVNTRLQKLVDGNYDGIVLALPGVERLALTESSKAELAPLLENLTFSVLPTSVFPAAASQGALGIECREDRDDNGELEEILSLIHHEKTAECVRRERKAFNDFGGGCHLAVGITVRAHGEDFLHTQKGMCDEREVDLQYFEKTNTIPEKKGPVFFGIPEGNEDLIFDQCFEKIELEQAKLNKASQLYLTSKYGLGVIDRSAENIQGLWSAGTKTWKRMSALGHLVHGSSDGIGEAELESLLSSKVLQMMLTTKTITSITHDSGHFGLGETIGAYRREWREPSEEFKSKIEEAQHFFWTSFDQYQNYLHHFPEIADKHHIVGLGKTRDAFEKAKIPHTAIPSMKEFKKWALN